MRTSDVPGTIQLWTHTHNLCGGLGQTYLSQEAENMIRQIDKMQKINEVLLIVLMQSRGCGMLSQVFRGADVGESNAKAKLDCVAPEVKGNRKAIEECRIINTCRPVANWVDGQCNTAGR